MGARAFLISDILRILTPEEISHLTTTSEADSRMPLTDVIKKYQKGELVDFSKRLSAMKSEANELESTVDEEGKVLPFDRSENERAPQTALEALGEKDEIPDTPSFILGEKKRFEQVQAKIREKEIFKMYQKSAAVDIQAERSLKEDLSKSSQLGILIDKKQS